MFMTRKLALRTFVTH